MKMESAHHSCGAVSRQFIDRSTCALACNFIRRNIVRHCVDNVHSSAASIHWHRPQPYYAPASKVGALAKAAIRPSLGLLFCPMPLAQKRRVLGLIDCELMS